MADDLDGKVYPVGTIALAGLEYTLERPAGDTTTDLTGAAIALRIFRLAGTAKVAADGTIPEKTRKLPPESATPTLTLTVGNGLERDDNTAALQTGTVTITAEQLETLLGAATLAAFSYFWVLTPVGGVPSAKALGGGYDGVFALITEGYSLAAAAGV